MHPFVLSTMGLDLPTYIIINSLVFSAGVLWIHYRAKDHDLENNFVLDLCLAVLVGCFVGARGFHVFFEHPEYYFERPLEIFKFWNGGFVFYGGLIGGLLGGFLFCRYKKQNFLVYADLLAPVLALGTSIGRLGCLAAGCCYGNPTNLPWGIRFPAGVEAPAGISLHPTQIYESLWCLGIFVLLSLCERRDLEERPGYLFGLWLMLYGIGRIFIEHFRGDFRGFEPLGLSISTWISLIVVGWGLSLLFLNKRSTKENASTTP